MTMLGARTCIVRTEAQYAEVMALMHNESVDTIKIKRASLLHSIEGISVKTLNLDGLKLSESEIGSLSRSLSGVKEISLVRCALGDSGVSILSQSLSLLERVNLSYNRISSTGIMSLSATLATPGSCMTELILEGNFLGESGCTEIAKLLLCNPPLRSIRLNGCFLSSPIRMGELWVEALEKNETLVELDLSRNLLGDVNIAVLSRAMTKNKSIVSLSLAMNGLDQFGCRAVANLIRKTTTLQTLNLRSNCLDGSGFTRIAQALESNTSIKRIYAQGNTFGDEGAEAIACTLSTNNTLLAVGLGLTGISEDGIQHIADMLSANKTLAELDLHGNLIGDNGAILLADSLHDNKALVFLNLEICGIGNQGGNAFSNALLRNSHLHRLLLDRNPILSPCLEALLDTLDNTRNVHDLRRETAFLPIIERNIAHCSYARRCEGLLALRPLLDDKRFDPETFNVLWELNTPECTYDPLLY